MHKPQEKEGLSEIRSTLCILVDVSGYESSEVYEILDGLRQRILTFLETDPAPQQLVGDWGVKLK